MDTKVCPVCGKGQLNKEIVEKTFTYKGQSIIIPNYILYRCNVCSEAIVNNQTLKSSGKQLKKFKCKVDGLLSGDEIKGIRRKLGLTQEQMSEILGGGLKGFARYETGQICQSKAMDNLLRILDKFPQLIQFIEGTPEKESQGARVVGEVAANATATIISVNSSFCLLPSIQESALTLEHTWRYSVRRTAYTKTEMKDVEIRTQDQL